MCLFSLGVDTLPFATVARLQFDGQADKPIAGVSTLDLHVFDDGQIIETFFNGEATITTAANNLLATELVSSSVVNTADLNCNVSSWILGLSAPPPVNNHTLHTLRRSTTTVCVRSRALARCTVAPSTCYNPPVPLLKLQPSCASYMFPSDIDVFATPTMTSSPPGYVAPDVLPRLLLGGKQSGRGFAQSDGCRYVRARLHQPIKLHVCKLSVRRQPLHAV